MQEFTFTFSLIIKLFLDLFLGLECKSLPLLFGSLSSCSQTYFQVQNARVYPYFLAHYRAILRLISRSRMQEFTLTFWLIIKLVLDLYLCLECKGFTLTFCVIIKLFLDLCLGLECKGLPLFFGSLSSYSQTYFQVQNARVYPYFLAHYPAILRLTSRSRKQGITFTCWLIIKLFLDLFLGLECKGLPLLFCSLSSYSQTYFQVQNARVYTYFFAHYRAILRLISRSRMQEFTFTFWLIIKLFFDLFLGLECKSLPLLFGSLSSCSQTYFQVQNARVYPYLLAHYPAILRLISRSRKQGFTFTCWLIIKLFLDLFLGLECKGLPLLFCSLSSYSQTYFQVQKDKGLPLLFGSLSSYIQTYFQVQKARVYPFFLAQYPAILSLISRSRKQRFTFTFWLIIHLFLNSFLGLECKVLPLHFGPLSSYSQTNFQVQKAKVYLYFLAHYPSILKLISRSRMQGFTLTFWLIIELFLDLFLGLECKSLPLLFGSLSSQSQTYIYVQNARVLPLLFVSLSSYSQTYVQVQNARVYPYFLAHYPAILRLISRSRMPGFTHTFWLIIQLFLDLFLGLESKGLPLLVGLLSSYSQIYLQVQNANDYPYFLAYYPAILSLISRSRMQGFTLTFWLIIKLFLD